MEFNVVCLTDYPTQPESDRITMSWDEMEEVEGDDVWEEAEGERSASHLCPTDYPTSRVLLTASEEIDLASRAQAGDLESRNRMIEANIRLVISIAKKYTTRSMVLEDLIQEGVFGLAEAISKFDVTRGYKFSTYATYWVRQGIVRAMEKQDRMIRLPSYGCNAEYKVKQAEPRLRHKLGRDPTVDELAVETGLSRRLIRALKLVSHEPLSLDAMMGADADTSLGELLQDGMSPEPEDAAIQGLNRHRLLDLIDRLPAREAHVIKKRFGLLSGRIYSLQEISEELQMSREGIRHMQNRALRKLRVMLNVPEPDSLSQKPRSLSDCDGDSL